jgi:hypothetical protein
MKSLNVLNRSWKIGDTRDLTKEQMDGLTDAGLYDSYDQTYELDSLKWKVAHRVANPDGSTIYTLAAVDEA